MSPSRSRTGAPSPQPRVGGRSPRSAVGVGDRRRHRAADLAAAARARPASRARAACCSRQPRMTLARRAHARRVVLAFCVRTRPAPASGARPDARRRSSSVRRSSIAARGRRRDLLAGRRAPALPKPPKLADTPPTTPTRHPDATRPTGSTTTEPGTTATARPRPRRRRRPRRPVTDAEIRAAFAAGAAVPARPVPGPARSTRSTPAGRCSSPRRPARARRSSPSTRSRTRSRRAARPSTRRRSRRCRTRSTATSCARTAPTGSACSPATTRSTATRRSW